MTRRHLYIGTPANGGIFAGYHYSMVRFIVEAARRQLELTIPPPLVGDSLVTRARDTIAHRFLQSEATDLLFIDADIDFAPDAPFALLESGHDVVCGIYPRKQIEPDAVRARLAAGAEDVLQDTASMVANFGAEHMGERPVVNGCFEIGYAPTGFLLIRRHVLERMALRHPELLYLADVGDPDPRFAFFDDPVVDDELTGIRRKLSEDWSFCRRWRQMGGKVWAHVDVELGHTGHYRYTGSLKANLRIAPHSEWLDVSANPNGPQEQLHIARYRWAAERVRGKLVANAACGTNYGAAFLECPGRIVVGFDRNPAALACAERDGLLPVRQCNVEENTFGGFDTLVSIETLEHLEDPKGWLSRLTPSLFELVLSTPIVPTKHANPYHLHDFTEAQLVGWLTELGWTITDKAYQDDPFWMGGTKAMNILLRAERP